jgi:hypothetical protein
MHLLAVPLLAGCTVGPDFHQPAAPGGPIIRPPRRLPQALPVSLPSRLVEQRPDVMAASAAMHAGSVQIGVAIANRLPQFPLTAAFGASPNAIQNVFTPYNQFYEIVAGFSAPIFQGGTLLHRQRGAEAQFDVAAAQYRQTVISAFQNVADVLRALQATPMRSAPQRPPRHLHPGAWASRATNSGRVRSPTIRCWPPSRPISRPIWRWFKPRARRYPTPPRSSRRSAAAGGTARTRLPTGALRPASYRTNQPRVDRDHGSGGPPNSHSGPPCSWTSGPDEETDRARASMWRARLHIVV